MFSAIEKDDRTIKTHFENNAWGYGYHLCISSYLWLVYNLATTFISVPTSSHKVIWPFQRLICCLKWDGGPLWGCVSGSHTRWSSSNHLDNHAAKRTDLLLGNGSLSLYDSSVCFPFIFKELMSSEPGHLASWSQSVPLGKFPESNPSTIKTNCQSLQLLIFEGSDWILWIQPSPACLVVEINWQKLCNSVFCLRKIGTHYKSRPEFFP